MNKKNEQEENKVFAFIAVTPRTRNSCPKAPHRTPPTQNHFNNHPQTRFREKLNQPPTPISLHVKCPNATDSKDFKANISLGGLMLPVVVDSLIISLYYSMTFSHLNNKVINLLFFNLSL